MVELSENAYEILRARYLWDNETSWEDLVTRVCTEVAKNERSDQERWFEEFKAIMLPMYFIPAGRILRNIGKLKPSTSNCNFLPIEDSIESIFDTLKHYGIISSYGGGSGINFSSLRPKGTLLVTKGGHSSGMISFIEMFNFCGKYIETGGQRRSAAIGLCDISHPEIFDFIKAKSIEGRLDQFNISVILNKVFLNAVETDDIWELKFAGKVYEKIKARELWHMILTNMLEHAEPGLINWDNLKKNNSYSFAPIAGVNPCITGDSLVALADGRGNITIKQLAEEGNDVPVFCKNDKGRTVVRMMRNPRITGYNEKTLKIKMTNGAILKCTENHQIQMKDGSYKKACELKSQDRLSHMVKFKASLNEIFKRPNSRSANYWWINDGLISNKAEHRLIAEYFSGIKLKTGKIVHHKNFDGLDNTPDNLEIMDGTDHTKLHGDHMRGDNNPINRFPELKKRFAEQDNYGINNSRYLGYPPEEVFKYAVSLSKEKERQITIQEWMNYCKSEGLPFSTFSFGDHKKPSPFLDMAAKEAGVLNLASFDLREYKKYLKLCKKSDLNVNFDFDTNSIFVIKICEYCKKEFQVQWGRREQCFCNLSCANSGRGIGNYLNSHRRITFLNRQQKVRDKQIDEFLKFKTELNRDPEKKEWEKICRDKKIPFRLRGSKFDLEKNEFVVQSFSHLKELAQDFNFEIEDISIDGYEDVYNGTVDEFHNFYVCISENKTRSDKEKFNYINNLQCGEIGLENWGVCNLGAVVLPKLLVNKNLNRKLLSKVIRIAIRFMDNIIDIAYYPIPQQDQVVKNARRIGLGTMGLADYLFMKQIRYGSEQCLDELNRLYSFIRNEAYIASSDLAKEKGAFPKYDKLAFSNASFVKKLPASIRLLIKEQAIRNTTLLSAQPTGTTALLADVVGGIEPLPFKGYRRVDGVGERVYISPFASENYDADWFVDSCDLRPEEHLEVQAILQKYIDSAVSKTIILPKDSTVDDLSKFLLEWIYDLKGVCVYRDESREKQVYYRLNRDEIKKALKDSVVSSSLSEEDISCKDGTCEI